MITPSTLIPASATANKSDLWIPPALFLPDWSQGITVRTGWSTDVASMQSAGEVRSGLSPKPSRSMDLTLQALDAGEAAMLRSLVQRMAMARTPVPLFSDQTPLTANATAGGTVVLCDTRFRRFFEGGLAVIWNGDTQGGGSMASAFEFVTIGTVASGTLTLGGAAGTLTGSYPAGAMAAPVMEADLVPQLSMSYLTDSMLALQLTFRETVGTMTLDPITAAGTTPDGVATYQDLAVFALPADWSGTGPGAAIGTAGGSGNAGGAQRLNETTKVGLVNYTEVHGSRFQASQSFAATQIGRDAAWGLMGFFDSRGGRLAPFLAIDLTTDFSAAAAVTAGMGTLSLSAVAPLLDWNWRTHLALVLADDSVVVRGIASVTSATGVDHVVLTEVVPALAAPIARIASAFKARFDTDELQETWITDGVLQAQLPQLEVLMEDSVDLDHMPAAPVSGGLRAASAVASADRRIPTRISITVTTASRTYTEVVALAGGLGLTYDVAGTLLGSDLVNDHRAYAFIYETEHTLGTFTIYVPVFGAGATGYYLFNEGSNGFPAASIWAGDRLFSGSPPTVKTGYSLVVDGGDSAVIDDVTVLAWGTIPAYSP